MSELSPSFNSGPREWDAETYDAVSDPQFEWGREVLDRLELRGDELVLDAGCGSGRVTAELAARAPGVRIVAVDGSAAMVTKAKERLGDRASYLVADLCELEVEEPVDIVLSTATFHWILDHGRLFSRLRAALRPGGRLVAQCGGHGNVADYAAAIARAAGATGVPSSLRGDGLGLELRQAGGDGAEAANCWVHRRPLLAGAQARHPGASP